MKASTNSPRWAWSIIRKSAFWCRNFWLPNDEYKPVYPLEVRKVPVVDHDAAALPELKKAQAAYLKDLERLSDRREPKARERISSYSVPVGQATRALREKIAAGQAPGIEKQSELFTDPWGHPTNRAQGPLSLLPLRHDLPAKKARWDCRCRRG